MGKIKNHHVKSNTPGSQEDVLHEWVAFKEINRNQSKLGTMGIWEARGVSGGRWIKGPKSR